MPRRRIPAPEQFTRHDALHILMALLMVPLGVIILVRTLSITVTFQGILVSCAFIGFGLYRLWLAWTRYGQYRQKGAVK